MKKFQKVKSLFLMSNKEVPRYNFTNEQIDYLKKSFDSIDKDKNGTLSIDEFQSFMRANNLDERFVSAIYNVFDENGDGLLDFNEFLRYIDACNHTAVDSTYLFKLIFDSIDTNKDGFLNLEEMIEFGRLTCCPMTLEQAKEEMKILDTDNNGLLDFHELIRAFGFQ